MANTRRCQICSASIIIESSIRECPVCGYICSVKNTKPIPSTKENRFEAYRHDPNIGMTAAEVTNLLSDTTPSFKYIETE